MMHIRAAQEDREGYCEEMQGTSDKDGQYYHTYLQEWKVSRRPLEQLKGLQDILKTGKFMCCTWGSQKRTADKLLFVEETWLSASQQSTSHHQSGKQANSDSYSL